MADTRGTCSMCWFQECEARKTPYPGCPCCANNHGVGDHGVTRIRAELRYWRAVLACWSYVVRPFDMLADRRRWFWQARTPCQFYGR